jgi:hypothetical protein
VEGGDLVSARALKALFGTVAGLFILWLAVSFLPGGGGKSPRSSEAVAAFFQGVTPESVSTIRITGPQDSAAVEVSRSGGTWTVNGFRADSANLARFWEALDGSEVGDLVAANPANHTRLGLSGDSAWTLELEVGAGSRTLLVGGPGPRYGTAFVRLPDANEAFLLEGDLRAQVTREVDDWRNKRVATVDTSAVQAIQVEGEDGGVTLQRSDSVWTLEGGKEADPATVRGILGEMARMDASGFYAAGDSLPGQAGRVLAMDQDGAVRLDLSIGSGDTDRWVRVAGDSVTYKIPSWRAARIFPDPERLSGGG